MAGKKKTNQHARRRIELMTAKQQLRDEQRQRRKRDNIAAVTASALAIGLAILLLATVFSNDPSVNEAAAVQSDLENNASASASSTPSVSLPAVPDPSLAANQTLTGTLSLNGQELGVELDGTKAPQAVSVLKTLSDSGVYQGRSCTRLTTSESAGIIQCGEMPTDAAGASTFQWGPVENAPQNDQYPAGTIAIARVADNANSNSTQFFITYKDSTFPSDSAGGYSVVGKVTSGLDVIQGFADAGIQGGANDGAPASPITIDSLTLAQQ